MGDSMIQEAKHEIFVHLILFISFSLIELLLFNFKSRGYFVIQLIDVAIDYFKFNKWVLP